MIRAGIERRAAWSTTVKHSVIAVLTAWCVLWGTCADAEEKSEQLYQQYEKLNTPANLAKKFVGGRPLRFVDNQVNILNKLAKRPTLEASPVVVRIAEEYLKRLKGLGAAKFRVSPLQSLQVPLIALLAKHSRSGQVFTRLETFAKSPLLKEYARSRAVGHVVRVQLAKIPADDDPDGVKRGTILMEKIIGDMSMSRLLHAPARLRSLAAQAMPLGGGEPVRVFKTLRPAAVSGPKKYAADYAFLLTVVRKQIAKKKTLNEDENKLLLETAGRWLKGYRPLVLREKYASDLVGMTVTALGGYPANENLRTLLRKNGVLVKKYVEPPKRRPPKRPGPK